MSPYHWTWEKQNLKSRENIEEDGDRIIRLK